MHDYSRNPVVRLAVDEELEPPRVSFKTCLMNRLSRWWDGLVKAILISALLLMSTGGYFIALNIFFPSEQKALPVSHRDKPAPVKIIPLEERPSPEKPREMKTRVPERSEEKPPARRTPPKVQTSHPPKRPVLQSLSADELVSIGEASIGKGSLPSLIFSYPDPTAFIRQMYSLGAKTLISVNRRYYEVNLFDNSSPVPFMSTDFEGFSTLRRVIDDAMWEPYKRSTLQYIGLPFSECALLLVVPMTMELKWIGHQTHVLQQLGIMASDVLTIEANFQNSRLRLTRAHLKSGMTQVIPDTSGA